MIKKPFRMVWWKWRQCMAWGYCGWQYVQVGNDEVTNVRDLEGYLDECHALNNWSDKYRGVQAVRVSKLPKKVIADMVRYQRLHVESAQAHLKELEAMQKRWYG